MNINQAESFRRRGGLKAMSWILSKKSLITPLNILLLALAFIVTADDIGWCETYGLKNPQGEFIPKVTIAMSGKEILLKKVNPNEKFKSFSITLNPKNKNLIRNIGQVYMEWLDASNKPSKSVLFAGPLYNANTRQFQDSLVKSNGIRLTDKSNKNLFASKTVGDLFSVGIDDQTLLSSEAVTEQDRTVKLGAGRDVSINVDKKSVVLNESNIKSGELITVENKSGLDQIFGVDPVEKGILYFQVVRIPEQNRVPKESWDRFSVAADSGFFIVVIPEPDPAQLLQLDGKEIIIKIYQGNKVRETRRIPIKIAEDLKIAGRKLSGPDRIIGESQSGKVDSAKADLAVSGQASTTKGASGRIEAIGKERTKYSMWLWILQIVNLLLLAAMAVYTFFFILPKMQILEDRLTKNEMFIHNSREAIREELDHLKQEFMQQSAGTPPTE